MDIDYFKSYNDQFGHQQGDDCIIAVATAIKNSILCPDDSAARFGGEEYVVILQDTDIDGALNVAKTIQQNVFNIKGIPNNPSSESAISLSIGIACNQQVEQCDAFKLIGFADQAMYLAKEKDRDQICYYQQLDEAVYCANINSKTNISELDKKIS